MINIRLRKRPKGYKGVNVARVVWYNYKHLDAKYEVDTWSSDSYIYIKTKENEKNGK